jgi:5S rRNA maturation endonuclease (ribonuclease M5)
MLYDLFIKLEKVNDEEHKGVCPFHEDVAPSFFANGKTHQWKCFGCDDGGGEAKFIQKYFDVSDEMSRYALEYYEKNGTLPFPTFEQINEYKEALKAQPAVLNYLHAIGVTDEIIEKFELGWEKTKSRIIIPIRSKTRQLVNLRRYMPPGSKRTKTTPKTINVSGLGENRYFPYEAFEQDTVFVFEGEKDTLVAISQGLNGVTTVGGTNLPVHEISLFKDKIVYLVTDSDRAGNKIVKKYIPLLKPIARELHRIKLPVKDFADYYENYKDADILQYAEPISEAIDRDAHTLKLLESLRVDTMDSTIVLENMKITGKHFNNYVIPRKLTLNCAAIGCKKECPYRDAELELEIEERELLAFIKSADNAQSAYLKKCIGCAKANVVSKEFINAQIVYFQEDLNTMTTEDYYNQMQTGIYLFEDAPVQTNKTYNFTVIKTSDPKTQQIVYIITDAVEKHIDIEVSEQQLETFKAMAQGKSIDQLVSEYYKKWLPHLEVYGREDLFRAMIMTYLSPVGFYWGNTLIKGWLDCIVIGDTRTGKSKMAKNFMKTIGLGAYISGENSRKTEPFVPRVSG